MRLIRCNRCGTEEETPIPAPNPIFGLLVGGVKIPDWSRLTVESVPAEENVQGVTKRFDMCMDCLEVFLLQFMAGAKVGAITKPAAITKFPHDPMTDCQLVFDPEIGGFLCYHDNPTRYHKLCLDNAQDVAEGVPPKKVQDAVDRLVEDVKTAGFAHSVVQRCTEACSEACSEAHTYEDGCLLMPGLKVDSLKVTECTGCRHGMHDRDQCRGVGRTGDRCQCRVHKSGHSVPVQRDTNGEDDGE